MKIKSFDYVVKIQLFSKNFFKYKIKSQNAESAKLTGIKKLWKDNPIITTYSHRTTGSKEQQRVQDYLGGDIQPLLDKWERMPGLVTTELDPPGQQVEFKLESFKRFLGN